MEPGMLKHYVQGGNDMKKLLTGVCVVAAAAAIQFGASADASAATIQPKDVTIDYANQKLTVTESSTTKDLQIGFSAATCKVVKSKVKDAEGKIQIVSTNTLVPAQAAAWEWHDGNANITIDLSSLNRAKDNYIQLKGDKNAEPLTIKIPAINSKVAAVFDAVNAKVTINDITDRKNPVAITTGTVEYRTQYSGWTTYTAGSTKLDMYQDKGATLNFRLAASAKALVSTAKVDTTSIPGESVYSLTGTFPGKELKVAVAKRANGPKVTADYVNVLFSLPAKTEYRFNKASQLGTWTMAENPDKAAKLTDIESNLTVDGTLEVRIAAAGNRTASKATKLAFAKQDTLTAPSYKSGKATVTAVDKIKANEITKNTLGADYSVAYSSKTVKKVTTNYVDITNNTDSTYQVIVANAEVYPTTTLPVGSARATATLAANKTVSVKVTDGQLVFIRKTGNAKQAIWATPYVALGKVVITKPE